MWEITQHPNSELIGKRFESTSNQDPFKSLLKSKLATEKELRHIDYKFIESYRIN